MQIKQPYEDILTAAKCSRQDREEKKILIKDHIFYSFYLSNTQL